MLFGLTFAGDLKCSDPTELGLQEIYQLDSTQNILKDILQIFIFMSIQYSRRSGAES